MNKFQNLKSLYTCCFTSIIFNTIEGISLLKSQIH